MNLKNKFLQSALFLCTLTVTAQTEEAGDSLSYELQELVVTAGQPATKLVGSTLVSTIAGTSLSQLGTALDVLAQLPMITVQDDEVSVVGKNSIEIYIDGRPMRDEYELVQLLSSNIKTVELLMAPGAEYSSTCGAVLKITTKRNFLRGLSVSDRLQMQRRRRWSFMDYIALTYRFADWELFANGSINHTNSLSKGMTVNTFTYDGMPCVIGSCRSNEYPAAAATFKAGFNYAHGEQSFGAYYRYNPERGKVLNNGSEWIDNEPTLHREIEKCTRAHSHLASLYYENRIADKLLLHFDGDIRLASEHGDDMTIYKETSTPDVKATDERKSKLFAAKLYLKFPLRKGDITIGTQDSYTHTSLDYRMLDTQVAQYIPSAFTDARQTSASAFVSWARIFGRFSLTAGLRYEFVDFDFKTDGVRNEDVSRIDHLITPDITAAYSFNEDTQLTLSYKLASVKPPYSQLTGSLTYASRHEIEGGNPALRDERMHDVRLFGMWKDFMLQADYMRSTDTYAFVKQLYPAENVQLIMHPVNIDVSAISAYLVGGRQVKIWRPEVTLGIYRQWLRLDDTEYNKPLLSYYFDNTISLPKDWILTANFSGRTRGDMHTNCFGSTPFTMDVSVAKAFLDRSLTVKLSATDIFNTSNNNWTMNTYGIFVDKRQSYDNRGVSLNIIYNFQARKSSYRGSSAAEEEMNRL